VCALGLIETSPPPVERGVKVRRSSPIGRWRVRGAMNVGLMMGLLGCTMTAYAYQEEPVGGGIGGWAVDGIEGFQDGTVAVMKMTEILGNRVVHSFAPMLEYGSSFDLLNIGLSIKTKYWAGVRLPQFASNLNLEKDFGFLSDNLNRSDSRWAIPLGAGLNMPFSDRNSFTITCLLNVVPIHSQSGNGQVLFPALTFGIRF
jgi:hypothetical protein